jgi:hypothetical protein
VKEPESRPQQPLIGEGACFFVLSRDGGNTSSQYGVIENVGIERATRTPEMLPNAAAYFLGTQDLTPPPDRIADKLPQNARLATYAHLYGIIPVAAAFDLAIGALSLKCETLFPSMPQPANKLMPNVIESSQPLEQGSICCFQLGVQSTFGWITIGSQQS